MSESFNIYYKKYNCDTPCPPTKPRCVMESVVKVKKSMRMPIKMLTSCVSGVKERKLCARRGYDRGQSGRSRGGGINRPGRTPPLRSTHPKESSVNRSYKADLEKERRQREAVNAQKNAERAAMRAHFRRKYQLSENPVDKNHLRSVGGKVSLPRELSKIIHPKTKNKDDGFNLLSAFQGLSFNTTLLAGGKPCNMASDTPANGNTCKVM
ncbi:complexin-3 [Gouania willdenowi]|uniref:complexin-3 n=1 Tax=Gouania willdenowi TaxID=441366 RepID=UPI001056B876|nr:complexin-3-like [Gouania willdenowi]